ncbi:MAG: glycosyltransferase family 39 protein [Phycisphaerae bacterium]|jgi:4-amino-4-deoxy-L-arabinose transferase-like glycosyltransferase
MDNKKIKGIVLFAVIAVSALTAFWGLGGRAIGNHEAYVGVTARNMISSGNWIVPMFNGEARLNKTPLSYWLVATAGKTAGRVNDFIVRLPSAVLAVVCAIAIFYFVSDWLGFRTGILSALVWSTSLCYMRYSHTGRPEMALAVFVTIAMLSFYSAIKTQERRKQIYFILIFWISFAFAMLAKGPAPLPLIIPAIFIYFLIFKRWKLIPKLLPIAGVILFLLIVMPWPAAVLMKEPASLEIWKNEFLGRAAGEYAAGSKPFYYYFGVMFLFFLPFSAFIPFAITAPFYKIWEERRDAIIYLWLWFFAGVAVMSFCGGKRQHYILPMMPAMAAMTGIILDDMLFVHKSYNKKFAKIFLAVYLVLVAIGIGVWLPAKPGINQDNEDDGNYVIRDFAMRAGVETAGKGVIAYCKVNPSFIYYFSRNVPVVGDINEIYDRYCGGDGIIATGEKFERLKKDGRFRLDITGIDDGRGLFVNK